MDQLLAITGYLLIILQRQDAAPHLVCNYHNAILFYTGLCLPVSDDIFFANQFVDPLELFRMIISGVLHKKTGFWIILTGAIIHQTGFFVFVVDIFNLFPVMTPAQELLLMIFPQMGIPLTYALHLAWEFGTANRDLRLQLSR